MGPASLRQSIAELRDLLRQVDAAVGTRRSDDLGRCGDMVAWCSAHGLSLLRWLGEPGEVDQLAPTAPWLAPDPGGAPQSDPDRDTAASLPVLVDRLRGDLAELLLPQQGQRQRPRAGSAVSASGRSRSSPRPKAPCVRLDAELGALWDERVTAIERGRYAVLRALRRLRKRQLGAMRAALAAQWRGARAPPGVPPLPSAWAHPRGSSAPGPQQFARLDLPCRAPLEAFPAQAADESPLRLYLFAQVGCDSAERPSSPRSSGGADDEGSDTGSGVGGAAAARARGQWEGFTMRVRIECSSSAREGYSGMELIMRPLKTTCKVRQLRHTWLDWADPVAHSDGALSIKVPDLGPGECHDLLVLGEVRAVGMTELVLGVGASPWGPEEHQLVASAAANAAGVPEGELRIVSVSDVVRGTARVTVAFPQTPFPREAQRALQQFLPSGGLQFTVRSAMPRSPEEPDLCANLRFRFRGETEEAADGGGARLGRTVSFSKHNDVGDALTAEVGLAERWGHHSARVREEVFRHNICTILDHFDLDDDQNGRTVDATEWCREVRRILVSPLYDHPLSQLRDSPMLRQLIWAAAGGLTGVQDMGERRAIAASVRSQRHIANLHPADPSPELRHQVYSPRGPAGVPAPLRPLLQNCELFLNELLRIELAEERLAKSVAALPPTVPHPQPPAVPQPQPPAAPPAAAPAAAAAAEAPRAAPAERRPPQQQQPQGWEQPPHRPPQTRGLSWQSPSPDISTPPQQAVPTPPHAPAHHPQRRKQPAAARRDRPSAGSMTPPEAPAAAPARPDRPPGGGSRRSASLGGPRRRASGTFHPPAAARPRGEHSAKPRAGGGSLAPPPPRAGSGTAAPATAAHAWNSGERPRPVSPSLSSPDRRGNSCNGHRNGRHRARRGSRSPSVRSTQSSRSDRSSAGSAVSSRAALRGRWDLQSPSLFAGRRSLWRAVTEQTALPSDEAQRPRPASRERGGTAAAPPNALTPRLRAWMGHKDHADEALGRGARGSVDAWTGDAEAPPQSRSRTGGSSRRLSASCAGPRAAPPLAAPSGNGPSRSRAAALAALYAAPAAAAAVAALGARRVAAVAGQVRRPTARDIIGCG
eukprot:TRINITY_DN2799_c0_g1_i2.p1 TRINITY_DN2799_c0_g1~~TRINITY_DN2799_c0_g1_i2.p1  ORF type:complete len:1139 (+),score=283.61 TRINITY_DN2799_c0_g1_i2:114-3419(+)